MSGARVYVDPHARCAHARYKVTCEEYDELAAAAGYSCGLCGARSPRLQVDHDHGIGLWAVRGLVCRRCNAHLRLVDAGVRPVTEDVRAYLATAWHIGRMEPAGFALTHRSRAGVRPDLAATVAWRTSPLSDR